MSANTTNTPGEGHNEMYDLAVGNGKLEFRTIRISDPVPTGSQILEAAGLEPSDAYVVIGLLPDRAMEDLRPTETFDLRGRGVEKVLVFETDRLFRFELNRRLLVWGERYVSGRILKLLAGVDPDGFDVFQDVPGGQDILIGDETVLDLDKPGVEHLVTVARKPKTYRIKVNRKDPIDWPRPYITGAEVKQQAGSPPDFVVNLKVNGPGEDPEIADGQKVDLTPDGVEHFTTRAPSTQFG
ncbi:multiubiquitin domain-containing protein [Methylobacterium sp. Leaf100]|uniref:multiubiquitin domain-containing protein n=1 Tax=Methylobacterium sp. Leaf100 TaxID=1736252 RepID=UPI0006F37CB1|nr:multiubiquitin domain-containing protein [Methylobacterium sp. Leaf100]KQP32827.1 hypothetical protein ASF25_17570 [Methylobacterium sp. Leaf100]